MARGYFKQTRSCQANCRGQEGRINRGARGSLKYLHSLGQRVQMLHIVWAKEIGRAPLGFINTYKMMQIKNYKGIGKSL